MTNGSLPQAVTNNNQLIILCTVEEANTWALATVETVNKLGGSTIIGPAYFQHYPTLSTKEIDGVKEKSTDIKAAHDDG